MSGLEIFTIGTLSLFTLLGGFLLSSGTGSKGFQWLGTFFIFLAINYLDGLLLINGFYLKHPNWAFIEDPLALAYGPLIWIFAVSYTKESTGQRWHKWLHFIPFILMEAGLVFWIIRTPRSVRVDMIRTINEFQLTGEKLIVFLPVFIHVFAYLFFSRRRMINYRNQLRQYYSTIPADWYLSIIHLVILIFTLSFVISFAQYFGVSTYYRDGLMVLNLIAGVLTYRILIKALKQPVFELPVIPSGSRELSEQSIEEIKNGVEKSMREAQAYKNPELTIEQLARDIQKSPRDVSRVINRYMAENFYDLVNRYRIEEAKRLLLHPKDPKMTILEILYTVGFNSKSSFNTQFRKYTGLSPSEFKSNSKK